MEVSIIIPTKNDENDLKNCLKSIRSLDYPKDSLEVLIVDGYSTDRTIEVAKEYGCKVMYENIGSRGGACNVGLKYAKGEFILFTDADCVVPKDWVKKLIGHFKEVEDKNIASVGGPNLTPEDDTEIANCVGTVLTFLSKPGSRYGLVVDRVIETFHNPGCNVAYRKGAIEGAGGFNERLITCEDEELDFRIKENGFRILYTPHAEVYHYRRPTWKKFYKQAYKYALGRMQAIKLHRRMGRWYHYIVPTLILLILTLFALSTLNIIYLQLALSILVAGGVGIALISLYLGIKTNMRNFFTYFMLIAIWFWGSGFGYLRGLIK